MWLNTLRTFALCKNVHALEYLKAKIVMNINMLDPKVFSYESARKPPCTWRLWSVAITTFPIVVCLLKPVSPDLCNLVEDEKVCFVAVGLLITVMWRRNDELGGDLLPRRKYSLFRGIHQQNQRRALRYLFKPFPQPSYLQLSGLLPPQNPEKTTATPLRTFGKPVTNVSWIDFICAFGPCKKPETPLLGLLISHLRTWWSVNLLLHERYILLRSSYLGFLHWAALVPIWLVGSAHHCSHCSHCYPSYPSYPPATSATPPPVSTVSSIASTVRHTDIALPEPKTSREPPYSHSSDQTKCWVNSARYA